MVDFIGYIGVLLLTMCAIPEVYKTITTEQCDLSWSFLLMWLFGEVFTFFYVFTKSEHVKLSALMFNYGINIILLIVLCFLKFIW
jgi:uncharacterized protein with PQ loop repeat